MAPGKGGRTADEPGKASVPSAKSRSKRKAPSELSKMSLRDEPNTELVFEDPYGDEFETDEEDEVLRSAKKHTPSTENSKSADTVQTNRPPAGPGPMVASDKVVFRPGIDQLAEGETLVCEESAYDVLHRLSLEWPALSFDFVCMSPQGQYTNINAVAQNTYPVSVMVILGTQATKPTQNKIQVVKVSNMHRIRKLAGGLDEADNEGDENGESDDENNDDDSDGEVDTGIADGILEHIDIKFDSAVNRIRALPQRPNIIAVWGDSGRVSLLDTTPALDALNRGSMQRMAASGAASATKPNAIKPFMSHRAHGEEGYALAWSPTVPGRLLSGACNGSIYLWEPRDDSLSAWQVSADRFRGGHRGSVEDLQWSPNEPNVFASCGVDGSLRFWDAREYRRPALSVVKAHDEDVNVISWNSQETHLMVSGGDEGCIKVWDMRSLSQKSDNKDVKPAAEFLHHKAPITSVEWHPRDPSMLAAASEDGSVSVWDLAVERDPEEELREGVVLAGAEQYPPQLMFIHMGQKNTKEIHWHPACMSLLASTAEDGFNIFKPANITLPS